MLLADHPQFHWRPKLDDHSRTKCTFCAKTVALFKTGINVDEVLLATRSESFTGKFFEQDEKHLYLKVR